MRIVFFTNKCSHGAQILKHLKDNAISLDAIFIDTKKSLGGLKNARNILKRDGFIELLRQIFKKASNKLFSQESQLWSKNDFYRDYSPNVFVMEDFNGPECGQRLEKIKPDLVILGGSKILRGHIIQILKIGILNAHPGLLPKYRGVDVIPWAILNDDEVGVTVHFVDRGVDTGQICVREVLAIQHNDSIVSLRNRAEELAGRLMAQTVLSITNGDKIEAVENPKDDGKQYYRMSRVLLKQAEMKLNKRRLLAKSPIQN